MTYDRNPYRQCPTGTAPYTIISGETLYTIAQKFNTTVQALLEANPGINPLNLYGGLQICVPQPQPQAPTCPIGTAPYTIIGGETLYTIAQKFNTTIQALLEANPGINPLNLYGGLQICVPQPQPQAPTCPIGTVPYIVKPGDTLAAIARKYNTTVDTLLQANPGINPRTLQVGQVICVTEEKVQEPSCPTQNYYVIREGDTFYAIASAFNLTIQELANANPQVNPANLYEGLVICIPLAPSPVSITISLGTRKLSLYRRGRLEKTYPIAIGKPSTPTPVGIFRTVNKQVEPGGPFGSRWIGLSLPHYGIHGTNNPASIGTAASNGCIRMYNEDVNELFNQVPVGTVVRIF